MITHNPKDWFKLITAFHKSDTFRRLIPAMIGKGTFTALVVTFEKMFCTEHLKISSSNKIYQK